MLTIEIICPVKWSYNSSIVRVIWVIILSHKMTQEEYNGLCHFKSCFVRETDSHVETRYILVFVGSGVSFPNEEGPRYKILSRESSGFLINRCLLDNCGKNAQSLWSNCWAPWSVVSTTRNSYGANTSCLQKLKILKGKCIIMIRAAKHLLRPYYSAGTIITTNKSK